MPGFSDYLENDIINTRLRGTATPHVTVSTAEVLDDGTGGGTITAVQAGTFAAPANGVTSNSATITFNAVAAGTYAYAQVWSDAAKTNLLYSGALGTTKTADAGDNLSFAAGQITVTNT